MELDFDTNFFKYGTLLNDLDVKVAKNYNEQERGINFYEEGDRSTIS